MKKFSASSALDRKKESDDSSWGEATDEPEDDVPQKKSKKAELKKAPVGEQKKFLNTLRGKLELAEIKTVQ